MRHEPDELERYRQERDQFELAGTPDAPFLKEQVVYGEVDGRELTGTLYLPRAGREHNRPAAVYLHGGGWRGGGRGQLAGHAAAMAVLGHVGLCITYRLSGEAPYPAAINDSKCAVRYLRERAGGLGIDSERIGAVGASSGAHLAAVLITTATDTKLEGDGGHPRQSSGVSVAVLFNGEYDLPAWWRNEGAREMMSKFLGGPYDDDPELYRIASPTYRVSAGVGRCLLLHGEEDETSPVAQSIEFRDRIVEAGGHAELVTVPGVGHGWFNHGPHYETCLRLMRDFIVRHL